MGVRVLYFAWVRERLGRGEDRLGWRDGMTVGDLIDDLSRADAARAAVLGERDRLRAAVGGVVVPLDAPVPDDAEVAIFPPVTGG